MEEKLSLFFLLFLRLNDVLHGQDEGYECSGYYFQNNALSQSWNQANAFCARNQLVLASIESNEEWEYLKNITISKKHRWYIGLKYFSSSKQWCWLSDPNGCLNETLSRPGTWRWYKHEPNKLRKVEHCVEMFPNGKFNNIVCDNSFDDRRYICEKKVDCVYSSKHLHVFKFHKTTVQPYTTKKKDSSGPVTQESSVQPTPPTYEITLSVNNTVMILSVLVVILLVIIGFILWRKRSPRKADAGMQNNTVLRTNQPRSSENVNESTDSGNTAVIIDEPHEESQQTRHVRVQRHYASLNQATMMEQTGVHSFAAIERTEMEEINHGHPVDYLNEMQLNENELDRQVYMNFTVTSHDYINV